VTRLVGYVAASLNGEPSAESRLVGELPSLLSRTLPDYMIPAGFVVLERLPRTANGKIDRRALPLPSALSQYGLDLSRRPFVPASTSAQKQLAKIWAEVLELSAISITDSIFELGADSLLIFRIAARAQREGLPVTATLIFQQRTVAGVCDALEQQAVNVPLKLTTRIAAASREKYRLTQQKVDA
jgi:hypothetical protein